METGRLLMGKVAWVAGATGLVGGHIVNLLNQDPTYRKVIAFVRKPVQTDWSAHDKVEQWTVDYDDLKAIDHDASVNDLFCALGTTKKDTPDAARYYDIDVNYPLRFSDLGLAHGAQFYGVVSAHGADAKSFSSYLKMKGQMEEQLQTRAYKHLAIARPGMLKGDRGRFRLGEFVGGLFTNFMPGNYKTINALDVAAALIAAASSGDDGVRYLASKDMQGASEQ
jgi:uncharacterized protein YbjT (DUF2867 family)